MPFTPFHMGPGALLKACLTDRFSLMVFGWSQILMDIQPLLAMTTGKVALHGLSHTYMGAVVIGLLAWATAGPAIRLGASVGAVPQQFARPINRKVILASAMIGTVSHVLLDSIMHVDVAPWLPLSLDNHLHGIVSLSAVHWLCLATAVAGLTLIAVLRLPQTRRPQRSSAQEKKSGAIVAEKSRD